jgi:hypothetical protein
MFWPKLCRWMFGVFFLYIRVHEFEILLLCNSLVYKQKFSYK